MQLAVRPEDAGMEMPLPVESVAVAPPLRGNQMRKFCLLAAIIPALLAQQPSDPRELLAKARDLVIARLMRLSDYVCVQTVDRQYFKYLQRVKRLDWSGEQFAPPSCAEIAVFDKENPRDRVLQSTDRLRLELKVSQGTEIGTWAGASQFGSRSVFDLVGGGTYETGTMGTFLGDIFENGTYHYMGEETAGTIKLAAYGYQVPLLSSHYRFKTGSGSTPTAFSGVFWIDSDSLEIRRLRVDANEMPPETGGCEATTTVEYQAVQVGAGEFLLPVRSSMRMVRMDGTETRTTAVYSGCREYRGEATIRFDDAAAPSDVPAAAAPASPLPAGISFSLALTSPIDTDTAAAGDVFTARLREAVHISKEVLVPAGARVEGRIVQMQHSLIQPRQFTISLMLEKIEVHGVASPLYARLSWEAGSTGISVPPLGQSPLVAALVFTTNNGRHIVRAGYQTNWVTVAPPPGTGPAL
jgi:hypothetical protein